LEAKTTIQSEIAIKKHSKHLDYKKKWANPYPAPQKKMIIFESLAG
jgi:hypothetical protein